ncbi:Alpha-(1,3)-fucosyltransferase 7, partial [Halocaridina rubra]
MFNTNQNQRALKQALNSKSSDVPSNIQSEHKGCAEGHNSPSGGAAQTMGTKYGKGGNGSLPEPKKILFWSNFITSDPHEWSKIFSRQIRGECPDRCTVTHSKLNWQYADVIIFKQAMNLKSAKYINVTMPPLRPKNQIWLLFSAESPQHYTWFIPNSWLGIFDWTYTYHSKSDAVMPFGRVIKLPPNMAVNNKRNYWAEKRNSVKFAAWMVSHCPTPSRREDYVHELQKHEQVDIYGACGNMKCGIRRILRNVMKAKDPENCYPLMNTYKFYFAFENSICEDYITEKFFTALQMDAIPVVFGGGNYNAIAPPHSFINGTAFEKPKDLAMYLRAVANNQTLYN